MSTNFKIGDLVAIKSSTSGDVILDCPPGIIIHLHEGYPLSSEKHKEKRRVAVILWDNGIEEQVDLEWLTVIKSLSG